MLNFSGIDSVIVLAVSDKQMSLGVAHLACQSGNAVTRDIRYSLDLEDPVDLFEVSWKYADLLAVQNGLLSHRVIPALGYLIPVPEFHDFII